MIPLAKDTINQDDINVLIEWLKTNPRLTKGEKTKEFEEKWPKLLNNRVKHSLFVNSGSSANLLMIYSLLASGLAGKGDQVVVPALSWATDLAPVMQLGFSPILCDCNLDDLSIDIDAFERICIINRPKALLLVHVLGLAPDMNRITSLCEKYNVILLEDTCEALGSSYKGQHLGTFGLMSSFSLFFGHHLSTIEGGVVCTNNSDLHNILLSIRSHGWSRDWDEQRQKKMQEEYGIDDFEAQYTFYYPGFNVRSTDLQAVIGLEQIKMVRYNTMRFAREGLFWAYKERFKDMHQAWTPKQERDNMVVSSFAFPVIFETHEIRNIVAENLKHNDIEVRPIICGSLAEQPFYYEKYGKLNLENAKIVRERGMYLPLFPELAIDEIDKIASIIEGTVSWK